MKISTKELRLQPGKIIDLVVNAEEVTVTFRGKALAKIVAISPEESALTKQDDGIFGMWYARLKDADVDDLVQEMRKGRAF